MKHPHSAFTESVNDGGLIGVCTLGPNRLSPRLLDCLTVFSTPRSEHLRPL
jgi:hypothetical protein